jgi:hypothetical protein
MISVDLSALWSDETDRIIKGILEATENIQTYIDSSEHHPNMLLELGDDIGAVCRFWTGSTYVGSPKKEELKNVFHLFFEKLMELLLNMKDSKLDFEKRVADAMLYRGFVYRYLGHNYATDEVVVPAYDNVYVSWNKEEENAYLLSKLHGPVTKMTCVITEPLYGIDLEILECCRGTEREVVFPTIEECITEINYLDDCTS